MSSTNCLRCMRSVTWPTAFCEDCRSIEAPTPSAPMSLPAVIMRDRGAPFDPVAAVLADREERRRVTQPAPRFDPVAAVLADRARPRTTMSVSEATLEFVKESAPKPKPRDERVVQRIREAVAEVDRLHPAAGELEFRNDDRRDHSIDYVIPPR
jgi:hypothetical protein